jgi:cyclopropane fatty-acyl-phospholipid synthase-like methyltransferase
MSDRQAHANADYYQQLHDSNRAFIDNNWLLPELDALRALGGRSILEVGCGNGRFLELAAQHWESVVGIVERGETLRIVSETRRKGPIAIAKGPAADHPTARSPSPV